MTQRKEYFIVLRMSEMRCREATINCPSQRERWEAARAPPDSASSWEEPGPPPHSFWSVIRNDSQRPGRDLPQ